MKNITITQEKINEIFDAADPQAEFQKLPVQTAFYAIKTMGLDEAHDLLALASTEQIIGFFDLDCWDKETIDIPHLYQWLNSIINTSDDKLTEILKALDLEILSYIFTLHTRIYRNNDGLDIRILHNFFYTEDNMYVIEVTKQNYFEIIKKIAYKIIEEDRALALNFFESIAYTLPTVLEETAYSARRARLEDLGIFDFYEAQDIYSYVKPKTEDDQSFMEKIREEPISYLPSLFWEPGKKTLFFDRVVAEINDAAALNNLKTQLLYLANKLISAHRINFSSLETIRERMEELRGTLNLSLEHSSQGNLDIAKALLNKESLTYLFKRGFSLTLDLKRKLESFLRLYSISVPKSLVDFFGEHYGNLIQGLLRKHPVLLNGNPEAQFIDSKETYTKTLTTVNYIENILQFLTKYIGFNFKQLNIHEKREITFVPMCNTLFAHRILHNQTNILPLSREDCLSFIHLIKSKELREVIKNDLKEITHNQLSNYFYENILKDTFDSLYSEIKDLDLLNFETRYITTLLLASSE